MPVVDLLDHFLFDLDGCLYLRDQVIPAAPPTLAELRRRGKGILFLTNDPRSPRDDYAAALRRMGIEARVDEILSCGWATAVYLKERYPVEGKSVFVVGSVGLKEEMSAVGLRVVEGAEARTADFVVVGDRLDGDVAGRCRFQRCDRARRTAASASARVGSSTGTPTSPSWRIRGSSVQAVSSS